MQHDRDDIEYICLVARRSVGWKKVDRIRRQQEKSNLQMITNSKRQRNERINAMN